MGLPFTGNGFLCSGPDSTQGKGG